MLLHEDRLFPAEAGALKIARALYAHIKNLPIISPHGHTQAAWFASNEPFPDPATLFVQPDHYVFRMLYSQGVSLDDLEIGQPEIKDPRKVWRTSPATTISSAARPRASGSTIPSRNSSDFEQRLSEKTADLYFDTIAEKLQTPEFLPRALFERFNIEVLSTTDSPPTRSPITRRSATPAGRRRILPAFRPDSGGRSGVRRICRPASPNWANRPAKTPQPGPAI